MTVETRSFVSMKSAEKYANDKRQWGLHSSVVYQGPFWVVYTTLINGKHHYTG
jgi:hypothetical protein